MTAYLEADMTSPAGTQHVASGAQHRARVLVADDQRDVLEALKLLLKGEGFEVDTAS